MVLIVLTLTCWGWPQLQLPEGAEWTCWLGHQIKHCEWHHSGCAGGHSLELFLGRKEVSRNHICWCFGWQSIKWRETRKRSSTKMKQSDPKHKISNTDWKGKFKELINMKKKTTAEKMTVLWKVTMAKWSYKLYDILSCGKCGKINKLAMLQYKIKCHT